MTSSRNVKLSFMHKCGIVLEIEPLFYSLRGSTSLQRSSTRINPHFLGHYPTRAGFSTNCRFDGW